MRHLKPPPRATMNDSTNPVLVEALRGPAVESRHRGALVVMDGDGRTLLALGDVARPVFPRSAVKLLQALPLVADGAADALGLGDEALAIACASHGGEPAHVATARAMLAACGLDESALECGAHWPSFEGAHRALAREADAPGALHNNCSGKHAGFVCLGCLMAEGTAGVGRGGAAGWLRGYVTPGHPVMRRVNAALATATGADLRDAPVGTDGCSIPTIALPLTDWARAFARVAAGTGLPPDEARAARRLRQAIARAPFMVAGSGRFDTRVMERLGERVCCKVGAEGVYCAALPERGLGVALKVDDGATARAAEVVMAAVIEALVRLDEPERDFMAGLSAPVMRNWNGIEVGRLQAGTALRAALAPFTSA